MKKLLKSLICIVFFNVILSFPAYGIMTSSKKGVGGMPINKTNVEALGVQWSYGWWADPNGFNNLFEYVPMITASMKKNNQINYTEIRRIATEHKGIYWLIFNEPDYYHSDNISSVEGAKLFKEIYDNINPVDPSAKFIVGGVYYGSGWLTSFINEYKNLYSVFPPVAGWHGHIYTGWSEYNYDGWRSRLNEYKNWTATTGKNKEFWLTEFGCLNSTDTASQVMTDHIPYLESQNWLNRYAWYVYLNPPDSPYCPNCTGSLVNMDEKNLTLLGNLYATFGSQPYTTPTQRTPTLTSTPAITSTIIPSPTSVIPTITQTQPTPIITLTTNPSPSPISPTITPTLFPCPNKESGNIDCDIEGKINLDDLNILLANWSTSEPIPTPTSLQISSDLNNDNKVDEIDLNILLINW